MFDSTIEDSGDSLLLFKMDSRVMIDRFDLNVLVANLAFNLNQNLST